MRTAETFLLQPVLAPGFGRPETLYFQAPYMANGAKGSLPWRLDAGDQIDGNTFFNMFLPAMWAQHARIGRVGIRIASTGRVGVTIIGASRDANDVVLSQKTDDGDFVVWLDALEPAIGRVYFRLSVIGATRIDRFEWVTDTPPMSQPRISIGICTYNRESFVAATLAALHKQSEHTPALEKIWVVNQGEHFTDSTLLALGQQPHIAIINQRNLGGCGGFTRSMLEAASGSGTATHHILMDDDVILDPRVIDRVVLFLGFCTKDIVLGGQMFEIERPAVIHEVGGRLHPTWYVESVGHNLRMDLPNALNFFLEPPEIDYNAWWFCVIPTAAIRKVGLPPPLFIRGDDIEYACRLRAAGIPTVPLVGVALWHESFGFKTSDWLAYYDLRNRLILSMMHPGMAKPPDGLYLLGYVMSMVFAHRYRTAHLLLKAIEDVLALPRDGLPADSEAKHREVLALIATRPGPPILQAADLPDTEVGRLRPLDPSVMAMVKMCVAGFIKLHLVRLVPRRPPLKFQRLPQVPAFGARDYVASTNPNGTSYAFYKSNLKDLWQLVFRTFVVCASYDWRTRRTGTQSGARIDAARSQEAWRGMFGISGE